MRNGRIGKLKHVQVGLGTDPGCGLEPVENGHRSCSSCILGNIAMRTGRKLKWDPRKEAFINDEGANRMRSRATRAPWRV